MTSAVVFASQPFPNAAPGMTTERGKPSFPLCPRETTAGSLQPLYEFVQRSLKPEATEDTAWRRPVLLVDDLSVLLSLGVGAISVLDFVHYCRATVCWQLKVPLTPVEPEWAQVDSASLHTLRPRVFTQALAVGLLHRQVATRGQVLEQASVSVSIL